MRCPGWVSNTVYAQKWGRQQRENFHPGHQANGNVEWWWVPIQDLCSCLIRGVSEWGACQSQDLSQFLPQPEGFPNTHANHRTYHKSSCLNLRTFWGVHTNCRIYCGCASPEDLRT